MEIEKSLCIAGIPIEFYKKIYNLFKDDLA